jgi:bifunctional non-homologous end joining protein LigD
VSRDLREKVNPLIIKRSPLWIPIKKPKATWLKLVILAEIAYGGLTDEDPSRPAVFKALRDNLAPIGDYPPVSRAGKHTRKALGGHKRRS